MSICVLITNAEDVRESSFNIPIATEDFFSKYLEPSFSEIDAKWLPTFSVGLEIERDDIKELFKEFDQYLEWASNNLDSKIFAQIKERINRVKEELPDVFKRKGVKVFIG